MATTTNFKQQCPSCEAMVPVRDPKLIGKKIDCPKCKYRFVVQDPVDDGDMDESDAKSGITAKKPANGKAVGQGAAGRKNEDRSAKKKKEGSSTTLILGVGLGAVALILLAVGGYFLFSGSEKKSSAPSSSKNNNSTPEEPKDPEQPPQAELIDPTNLLPNESDAVRKMDLKDFEDSLAGKATFHSPGAFTTEAFVKIFGFQPKEVERLVTAINVREDWVFNVLRLASPVTRESLANLNLKEGKTIGGLKYDSINTDLDPFSFVFLAQSKTRQLNLYLYDNRTIVVADTIPMERFLEAKGQPKNITPPPSSTEPEDKTPEGQTPPGTPSGGFGAQGGPAGGFGASGGSRPGGPSGGPSGSPLQPQVPSVGGAGPGGNPKLPPGFTPPGGGGGANPGTKPPATTGSYLTVNRALKDMMDRLDDPKKPALVTLVADMQSARDLFLKEVTRIPGLEVSKFAKAKWEDISVAGVALQVMGRDKVTYTLGVDCKSDGFARTLETETRTEYAKALQKDLKDNLELSITLPTQGRPTGPGVGSGFPPFGPSGGFPNGGASGFSPPPGGADGGDGGPPSGPGGKFGGGFSPTPGGPAGGFPGGPAGGFPGPGGPSGFQGAFGGNRGGNPEAPPSSTMKVEHRDRAVVLTVDLVFDSKKTEKSIELLMMSAQQTLVHLKGEADMADGRSRIHELAKAIKAYADVNKKFPSGAAYRKAPADRKDIPWLPNQRVSWLAELLPFIGRGEYTGLMERIKYENSWRDLDFENEVLNLFVAKTVIPCFLSPKSPPETWWISYPGLEGPVASTHFVGIAGIGLDAADYSKEDVKFRKKLGVFGYDRSSTLAEITDGLEQTIVAIQVPMTYKTPWLAGGGSTVRGVSETNCVAPFVCTQYNNKPGTFAIMADGVVRFIPADITDAKFKALCTICGDDKISAEELDQMAPVVPGGETQLKAIPPGGDIPVLPVEKPTAGEWKEFTSEEGGFSVKLPGDPMPKVSDYSKASKEIQDLKLSGKEFTLDAGEKQGIFSFGYDDVPAETMKNTNGDKLIALIKKEVLAKVPAAKIQSDKKSSIDGHDGQEITLSALDGKLIIRVRIALVDHRLYSVGIIQPQANISAKVQDDFLDSFKLIQKK